MKRRAFLGRTSTLSLGASVLGPQLFNIIIPGKFEEELVIGHGDFRYTVNREWAQISPNHNPILNCHEMVQASSGRLYMIGDHTANNIMVFDPSGKLLDHWGTNMPGGHGLTLSPDGGEDNLFVADCGWFQKSDKSWHKQAGFVNKVTNDGRLIFSIGHPRTIGVYEDDQPFMPTEIAVGPGGDFYVADGYGSDIILHYDEKGRYIRHFGGRDNTDPRHNLNNAHGIAIDSRDPDNPSLVISSRNDYQFKHFTLDGQYLKTTDLPGAFVCRPVIDDENIYSGVCWSETKDGKRWERNTGFVTILDSENKVVSNPGGSEPKYNDGILEQMFQGQGKQKVFNHGHDVCVDSDKSLYICQWNAYQSPPVKLDRV